MVKDARMAEENKMQNDKIKAQLPSGQVLEFPAGTEDSIVDMAVKREMGLGGGMPSPSPVQSPNPKTQSPNPTAQSPEPSFMQGVVEEAPQVGGGMALGIAGAKTAAGVTAAVGAGTVVGAAAGLGVAAGLVALGGGAGEAYKQLGQHLSGSLDAPQTSMEAAKRIGKAGLTEAGWELIGGLAAKGFGKILSPFKSSVTDGASDVMRMFRDKIKPVVFLPAEATESRVLDLLQNISESSILGGGGIQKYKASRIKFFDDFADSIIREFGEKTDPTDLGNLFVTSINNSKVTHAKASKILYNSVKAGKAKTETRKLKNFVAPLKKRAAKLEGIESKNAGDDLVAAVVDLPEKLSFKEATELRSRLISRIDEFSIINKKAPAIGKAKKLVGLLDGAIERSLKGSAVSTKKVKWSSWDEEMARQEIRKTAVREFSVNHKTMNELPGIVTRFEAGERKFYRGTIPGAAKNEPIRKDFYPMAKRDPGTKRRAIWMAKDKRSTIHYGSQTEEIIAKPEAKILYEGTEEFGRVMGITDYNPSIALEKQFDNIPRGDVKEFERTGGMLPLKDVQNMVTKGKDAGFDALSFAYDDEIGTVMFNEKAFTRRVGGKSEALTAWRTANSFYKDGQKKFNNTLLRRLTKLADDSGTGAEMIAPTIFKPGHVSDVRKVKVALANDPETWKKMQGFCMQHIMQKSVDVNGVTTGKKLINTISGKPNSFGMPLLQEVFSDPQIKTLKGFAKAVELSQKRQAEGAGKVLIQLAQAGAVGTLLSKGMEIPAATIIFGPPILSKMLLNPTIGKLLTTGISIPARLPEAAGVMARLTAAAWRAQTVEEK